MSLRAKLEAVIYAAEEPVTLAQLAALFAEEALAWKAEQAAAEAAAQPGALPMIDEGLEYLGLEQSPAFYAESEGASPDSESLPPESAESDHAGEAQAQEAQPELIADAGSSDVEAAAPDPESEAKREARARDREVKAILRQVVDELIATFAAADRGTEIREIAGGYRMATKPECHDAVRSFIKSLKPPMKLSLPALETLAVIAYKQPVTAPEVNEIRGVESGGVLGSLLGRKLITTAGRKQVIGRPILYKTTKEFLLRFGLKDISELPSMEEFEKMAAIELSETVEGEEPEAAAEQEGPDLDENAAEDTSADEPEPAKARAEFHEQAPTAAETAAESAQLESSASNEHAVVETATHD
jgi:segregation and condensation protein B